MAGFVVDSAYREADEFDGLPLSAWSASNGGDAEMLIAIGYRSMRARADAAMRVVAAAGRLATIVSPGAHVAHTATLGQGSVIFPGCVVEHFAAVGTNNVLWSGTVIAHDTSIGADNYLAPGVTVSGDCRIGSRCFFGTSATLIDGISVGDDCHIAPGAVLSENAAPRGRYAGIPARRTAEIDEALGVRIGGRDERRERTDQ